MCFKQNLGKFFVTVSVVCVEQFLAEISDRSEKNISCRRLLNLPVSFWQKSTFIYIYDQSQFFFRWACCLWWDWRGQTTLIFTAPTRNPSNRYNFNHSCTTMLYRSPTNRCRGRLCRIHRSSGRPRPPPLGRFDRVVHHCSSDADRSVFPAGRYWTRDEKTTRTGFFPFLLYRLLLVYIHNAGYISTNCFTNRSTRAAC